MPITWWTRLGLILAALLWGSWTLVPCLVGESAQERNAAKATTAESMAEGGSGEDAAVVEEVAWWRTLFPDECINLGLDLQGGIDMTLQVEVEEAVVSSVQRDVKPLRDAAEREGLSLGEVIRARGEPVLLVEPAEGVSLSDVMAFVHRSYSIYEYENTREVAGKEYLAFRLSDTQAEYVKSRAVEQALETLRNRIDETGVKEPSIVLKGGSRINVQLPGEVDIQSAIKAIGTTAVLEFMLVDEEAMAEDGTVARFLKDAKTELDEASYDDDDSLSDWMVSKSAVAPTNRLMWEYADTPEGKKRSEFYVIKDSIILTGDDINDAHVSWNQLNQPYVALEFKPRGAQVFSDITGENVGRRFAIVLDNQVKSAPKIREKIGGGRASIEMGVNDITLAQQEAKVLALVLRTGALPAPVTIGDVRTVGASLGADAIRHGSEAAVVGSVVVIVFMVFFYRRSGVVSVMALGMNVVLVMALLATAGATLTLPGIAGIALTVGMAVDCNIIIFERIREELRLGKNSRAAADAGFEKALWAVLDANITTFIAGVVLYTYGTGPIKGFAVTLMIGIITTLFTGIFVSRTMIDVLTRRASARLSI